MIRHLPIRTGVRPAIAFLGVLAGFWCEDVWQFMAALTAAAFIDVKPWEPYGRKSNEAPD